MHAPKTRRRPDYGLEARPGPDGHPTLLPGPDEAAIAAGVRRWRFAAYGKRPDDHMGRDLLFGSLGRDHRAWPFRSLRSEPPDWIPALAAAALGPEDDPREAPRGPLTDHLILRLIHERHLASLVGDEAANRARHDRVNALYACRPMGLLLRWHEEDGHPHDFRCWNNRACPWCHVRKALRLHADLRAGPCDPARACDRVLVLAKVRVDDPVDAGILEGGRVAQVLGPWKEELARFGRRLGVLGGLVTYQVGPLLGPRSSGARGPTFRHELALLGEVDCTVGGHFSQEKFDRMGRVAGFGAPAARQPLLVADGAVPPVPVEVTAMRLGAPSSLRWLLAGSAAHPMWGDEGRVRILRNAAVRTHDGQLTAKGLGVDGALALQPTFLFAPAQFWSYVGATRGRHLYAPFGSWLEALEGPTAASRRPLAPRRLGALEARNRSRRAEADEAIARLLPAARSIYQRLARGAGRPPGRVALGQALADAGVAASRRQVVALVDALKPSPAPAPGCHARTR